MGSARYVGFVPCRAGSERVDRKNTRPFAGFEHGLLELKLRQLAQVQSLDTIIVSSNDDEVLTLADGFAKSLDGRIAPLERPDEWGVSATSMGQFITDYIANLRQDGIIFWTHVTSPLITAAEYDAIAAAYDQALDQGYDSLVTVTKLQKFIWSRSGPVNYDPAVEKWPRSQDLEPLFEINHGAYVLPFATMRECGDRMGRKPWFHELPESVAMDIDWPDQFVHLEEKVRQALAHGQAL